jgi:hypothetical protein
MSSTSDPRPARRTSLWRRIALFSLYPIAGFAVGTLAARLGLEFISLPDLGLSTTDVVALCLAAFLLLTAGVIAWAARGGRPLSKLMKLAEPADHAELSQARLQAVLLVLTAILLALPPLISALGMSQWAGIVVIGLLLLLHTVLNIRLFVSCDELLRRTVVETCAVTMIFGQMALFICAAAGRLQLIPAIDGWDVYVVMMATYLVAGLIVSTRRGLA